MNFYILLLSFVIVVSIGSSYSYALDYTYPTINQRLPEIPTYCAVESISDKIDQFEMNEMISQSELAVYMWKTQLQESDSTNKEFFPLTQMF